VCKADEFPGSCEASGIILGLPEGKIEAAVEILKFAFPLRDDAFVRGLSHIQR